jgi:hypothetical protein
VGFASRDGGGRADAWMAGVLGRLAMAREGRGKFRGDRLSSDATLNLAELLPPATSYSATSLLSRFEPYVQPTQPGSPASHATTPKLRTRLCGESAVLDHHVIDYGGRGADTGQGTHTHGGVSNHRRRGAWGQGMHTGCVLIALDRC